MEERKKIKYIKRGAAILTVASMLSLAGCDLESLKKHEEEEKVCNVYLVPYETFYAIAQEQRADATIAGIDYHYYVYVDKDSNKDGEQDYIIIHMYTVD